MERQDGFTLIELMIVVVVIAVLAAVAVVGLQRSRLSANEASAIGSMRTLSTGEAAFKAAALVDADGNGEGDYGELDELHTPPGGAAAPFIDEVLASGAKQGYEFEVDVTLGAPGVAAAYEATAVPSTPGRTGVRRFFVDDSGVIRFTADGSDPDAGSGAL